MREIGVDGIFVLPPTGTEEVTIALDGVVNPEIWTDHIKAIAKATELPLIIHASHPITAVYGKGMPVENVKMVLDKVPSVVGWKMIYSIPGFYIVANYLRSLKRHVGILNAPHQCLHTALISGLRDGAVNGGLNFDMEPFIELLLALKSGDSEKAKSIWNSGLTKLWDYIYTDREGYVRLHIRYKIAAWIRGNVPHPFMRPPMPPPRKYEIDKIYELIVNAGLSHISHSELEETFGRKDAILKADY